MSPISGYSIGRPYELYEDEAPRIVQVPRHRLFQSLEEDHLADFAREHEEGDCARVYYHRALFTQLLYPPPFLFFFSAS